MTERSIEAKVGLLILVAIGLLAAFILVMGGINFRPTFTIFVDFDNPGALQSGAPVKIAGVRIGKVDEVQFRGGVVNPQTGKREPLVRIKASIERRFGPSLHDNATFYVTSQGVLGEQYLQVDPGSADRPLLAVGTVVRGLDPPRLDMLLSEGYELLHTSIAALRDNRDQLAETFQGLHNTLKGTGDFFAHNTDRLDRVVQNVERITVDVDDLVRAGRARYVDNPQVTKIIDEIEQTTANLSRDSGPLIADAREAMNNLSKLSTVVGGPAEREKIKTAISDLSQLASHANATMTDAQAVVSHIKRGQGSVGALVMDEQIYDDLQELVRDLKHNPWKFFWRN